MGVVTQSKDSPDPRTFIGEGKVAEVKEVAHAMDADMVIFDNGLSPSQQRVLSEDLGVSVLDRSALILDIFAQRARTREGRLQVELAQYKYLLPRLTGMWKHLERQEGAIGTRGPGETQLESDRRHIPRKIAKLESELKEVKHRIEDALQATRAAVEEGIVAGGGTAYVNAVPAVEKLIGKVEGDEKTGVKIIVNALQEPVRQIAKNAGVDGSVVLEKIKSSRKVGYGFDAYKEVYCDMIGAGIVDPAKVTRSALENAASVSSMVLTTEALVADKPEPPAPAAPAGMGGMDGMY